MRRTRRQYSTRCLGGVNQQADLASMEECSDALNVWDENGRVVTRPGYQGLLHVNVAPNSASFPSGSHYVAKSVNGTVSSQLASIAAPGSFSLGSLVAGRDFWFVGNRTAKFSFVRLTDNSGNFVANTANTTFRAELWDGTRWYPVFAYETTGSPYVFEYHLNSLPAVIEFYFQPIGSWETSTVDGIPAYWIRFRVGGADTDAGTAIALTDGGNVDVDVLDLSATPERGVGAFSVQFSGSKKYIWLSRSSISTVLILQHSANVLLNDSTSKVSLTAANHPEYDPQALPPTLAIVPQFDEAFVAYNGVVMRHTAEDDPTSANVVAEVDTRDASIGPAAPYDKNTIALDGVFPRASLISFFNGRLWAAGIEGDPFKVQWSGAQPYHKVWPTLSYTYLMEDDNSYPTALKPLNEHMVVYKRDSIWLMIPVGENPVTATTDFVAKKVVAGIGCVAPDSIKSIRGRHIFLSEDGLYAFDGTPNIRKVTERDGQDRLPDTMSKLDASRARLARAAHWPSKRWYMLSFSTGGEIHDTTVGWNYDKDSWWIWDGIDAQVWMEDEGAGDERELYFVDNSGYINRFGVGKEDHGSAITSYAETTRMGLMEDVRRKLLGVKVLSANQSQSLSVTATVNGGRAATGTIDLTDYNETVASTPHRRREKRLDMMAGFDWVRVKIQHSTRNARMFLTRIDAQYRNLGRR